MDTPQGFEDRIASFVVQKDMTRERRRFGSAGALSLLGLCLLFFALGYFMKSASLSGFSAYLSLFTSDSTYLAAHFKEFILSLAESIPAFSLALIFCACALFTGALMKSAHAFKRSHLSYKIFSS